MRDEEFYREVEEAARVREDEPLADRMVSRKTQFGNVKWRERPVPQDVLNRRLKEAK